MYIGSVRFYKHLILSTIALMIIVPSCLSVFFGIKSYNYKKLSREYYAQLTAQTEEQDDNTLNTNTIMTEPSFEYQTLYPDMYVDKPDNLQYTDRETTDKPIVYLTFDDGPSTRTEEILDTLKENDIKATFFVVNTDVENHQYLYKRIADEGHTLGLHTYSHKYKEIYNSVDEYLEDFYKIYSKVYQLTGVKPTVFRFAGGSINVYNQNIYMDIVSEMVRRGFTYFDWNVVSGDVGNTNNSAYIYNAVVNGAKSKDISVVLMHDSSTKTALTTALPAIITELKDTHVFMPVTWTTKPVTFTYLDNKN